MPRDKLERPRSNKALLRLKKAMEGKTESDLNKIIKALFPSYNGGQQKGLRHLYLSDSLPEQTAHYLAGVKAEEERQKEEEQRRRDQRHGRHHVDQAEDRHEEIHSGF